MKQKTPKRTTWHTSSRSGKFDLSDIFANDNEDEDDKDYGSAFNRLFDEAKDFDSDEKKEGDK